MPGETGDKAARPDTAARTLVREALDSGSDDNISVAIAEFGEVPRSSARAARPIDVPPPAQDDPGSGRSSGPVAGEETPVDLPPIERHAPDALDPATDPVGPSVGLIVAAVAAVVVLLALLTL